MRAREFIKEESIEEINWRKAAATGALALGALGAMGSAQARVTPNADGSTTPSAAQQMAANPDFKQGVAKPGGVMPNQDVDKADKVERTETGIIVHFDGKEYEGVKVSKDGPTPRGAKMIKITQGQMGERGIGNYTTYLLPNGKAFIYSK
jgi:hypothetical protein